VGTDDCLSVLSVLLSGVSHLEKSEQHYGHYGHFDFLVDFGKDSTRTMMLFSPRFGGMRLVVKLRTYINHKNCLTTDVWFRPKKVDLRHQSNERRQLAVT
jgi:hypothetical protein